MAAAGVALLGVALSRQMLEHAGAWLIALLWMAKFLEAAFGLPRVADLTRPEFDRSPDGQPWLAVIVPARNEAAKVCACVESLVAQDYPRLRVIAIDDRSTDQTGAILDGVAARHPGRVDVLHVTALPEGWLGKTHAMALGAAQAVAWEHGAAEYLLFTDADVVFHPQILRRTLAQVKATGADHFVTLPTTLVHAAGEAMLLSFLQVLGLFAVRPWRVSSPRSRDAIGVGAFNLLRTQAYLELEGFAALRMEVLDDLTLGRRVKAAGMRQRAAYAPGAVAVHWAPGLLGVLHGMTKNLFALFGFRASLLMAAALGLGVFWIGPFALLGLAGTRVPAALALASLAGLYVLAGRRSLISPGWAALAPIAALLLIYSMLRSMTVTLRDGGVTWRGTFYPLAVLRGRPRQG